MYLPRAQTMSNCTWRPMISSFRFAREFGSSPTTYKGSATKTQVAPKKASAQKSSRTSKLTDAKAFLADSRSSKPEFEPKRVTKAIEEILLADDGLKIEWQKPSPDAVYRRLPLDTPRLHHICTEEKRRVGTLVVQPKGLKPTIPNLRTQDAAKDLIAEVRALDGTPVLWIARPRLNCIKCDGLCTCGRGKSHLRLDVLRLAPSEPISLGYSTTSLMVKLPVQRLETIGFIRLRRFAPAWTWAFQLYRCKPNSLEATDPIGFGTGMPNILPRLTSAIDFAHSRVMTSDNGKIMMSMTSVPCGNGTGLGTILRVRGSLWRELKHGPTGHFAVLCPLATSKDSESKCLDGLHPGIEQRAIFFAAGAMFGLDLGRWADLGIWAKKSQKVGGRLHSPR